MVRAFVALLWRVGGDGLFRYILDSSENLPYTVFGGNGARRKGFRKLSGLRA
jgi:hypothetical protein